MNTALAPTAVSAADSREGDSTRRMPYDDWVVPEPRAAAEDPVRTSVDAFSNSPDAGVETTNQAVRPIEVTPYRRDVDPPGPPDVRTKLLQHWECIVLRVNNGCIECEMHDLTREGSPVEFAELELALFNHFDRELLQPGAVFYWSVGYKTKRTGQVEGFYQLRVRRVSPLSRQKKLEIERKAARLSELFNTRS